jgi:proteasome accessory factor B
MAGGKFKPQYRRILHIHRLLKEGRYPNAVTLSEHRDIECSPRTIKRDIQYMKYDLDAPIEYDPRRNGYYYAEPGWEVPSPLMVTEGELFSLAVAEHILEQYRNTPVFSTLKNVFGKIEEMLPSTVTVAKDWLESVFSFTSVPGVRIDTEVWRALFGGMKTGRKLLIWYKTPGYDDSLERMVSPYHIFCNDAQWYVIGHDSYSEDIRLFALHRIEKLKPTDFPYSVPRDFDYRNYIDAPLGMFIDEELHPVKLLFFREAAPYIREREWHPDQRIEERSDGSLLLEFRTRQLQSVLHWVLTWSGSVKVLGPEKLVEMTKKRLADALERYGEDET